GLARACRAEGADAERARGDAGADLPATPGGPALRRARRHTTAACRGGHRAGGVRGDVQAFTDHLPLDERTELELFRVVREAVHNGVKHAHPNHIEIRLYEPAGAAGTLVVEVADDGVGFDPDDPHPGHLGLKTMRERTERLGGQFTVDSSPTGSTTVRAVLSYHVRSPSRATGS